MPTANSRTVTVCQQTGREAISELLGPRQVNVVVVIPVLSTAQFVVAHWLQIFVTSCNLLSTVVDFERRALSVPNSVVIIAYYLIK